MKIQAMRKSFDISISLSICLFLAGSATGSAVESLSDNGISKRVVSAYDKQTDMMRDSFVSKRSTRDVPMLRLGRPFEDDRSATIQATKEQLNAFLREFLESQALRDERRRQPPLPRYGRRSVQLNRRSNGGNLNSGFVSFEYPDDDPVFRPPPRGGRYKRSLGFNPALASRGEFTALFLTPYESQRISRYLQEKQHDMRAKAVPRPRIGRETGSGSSEKIAGATGPMADPRGL
ncbi:myomodulin neuropeptides 2 [Plakobranchus ocellatus]|uniref:Myomodulin neuropeptides 2 n=1 Tax=Plakobranchus ocellatus TaxID=259542 RepID=A0AAV3ZVZ3_9GAST|nr:myomodulin neuropeptides 2 [Plakobranchus ocellatus]